MTHWTEGAVALGEEHIQLSWGSIEDARPIARLAPAGAHAFTVQFLVDKLGHATAVAAVTKELNFFLIENREPNPWAYARYHCNTGSNLYSSVHWELFKPPAVKITLREPVRPTAPSWQSSLSPIDDPRDPRDPRDLRDPRTPSDVVPSFDGLGPWIEQGRERPGFRAFWDEADPPTRAYVIACVALADLAALGADERATVFDQLAAQPRATVLASMGRGKFGARSLKTFEHCDAVDFRLEDWRALFSHLEDAKTCNALGHVKTVTPTLVRQLASVPVPLRLPALLDVLAVVAVDRAHWDRLANALEQAGPDRRATLIRSARDIRTAADLWDLSCRCIDAALTATMTRRGPVDLGPRFVPLVDEQELRLEGQRMENCLGRLVDRAARGQSAYFVWEGEPRASVELTAVAGDWVLGEVAGHANEPLDAKTERAIRAAVGEVLGPSAVADRREATARSRGAGFEHCIAIGRRGFSETDRAELAEVLWSIHGRALSPSNGAYVIVPTKDNFYFQCLADPGSTYFVELSSHRYTPAVSDHLTSETVALLETSGFEWPRGKANFKRIFRVESRADCVDLADFALGALWELFGVRTVAELGLKVHVPIGDVEREARAQLDAMIRRP